MNSKKTTTNTMRTKSKNAIKGREEAAHCKGFDAGYLSCIEDFLYADHHIEGLGLLLKRLPYLFHCSTCAAISLCKLVDYNEPMNMIHMLEKLAYALSETVANKDDQHEQAFIVEVQALVQVEANNLKD